MNAHITDYSLSEPISVVPEVMTIGFCVNLIWTRGAQDGLLAMVVLATLLKFLIGVRHGALDKSQRELNGEDYLGSRAGKGSVIKLKGTGEERAERETGTNRRTIQREGY